MTLIDVQVDLLRILDNSLYFMERFAPKVFASVLLVAYDIGPCSNLEKNLIPRLGIPCFYNSSWVRSIRRVIRNLKCNRKCQSGHDMNLIMIGRLVTTLSLLCADFNVFLTDTDVILLEDPIKSIVGHVDMIFSAEQRRIKKFYSSTPPGRWYIRPLLHNVTEHKYASFALNNGVIYYRNSSSLKRWYLYFSEFIFMNLGDGFLQTNFVEFFKQHRLLLFGVDEIAIEKTKYHHEIQNTIPSQPSKVIRDFLPHRASFTALWNVTVVAAVLKSSVLKYCIDCAFGILWVDPQSLLPENKSFWSYSRKVWERAVEFTLSGTKLAPEDQMIKKDNGFPLVIGMFSNFRWIAHCTQLQDAFPTSEQKAYIRDLLQNKIGAKQQNLISAYHANCETWPQEKLNVIRQMGLWKENN